MFNIGLSELVVIFFVAYIIVGPKDLSKVARQVARAIKKLRKMVDELKAESGWDDVMNSVDEVKRDVASPVEDAQKELKHIDDTVKDAVEEIKK